MASSFYLPRFAWPQPQGYTGKHLAEQVSFVSGVFVMYFYDEGGYQATDCSVCSYCKLSGLSTITFTLFCRTRKFAYMPMLAILLF